MSRYKPTVSVNDLATLCPDIAAEADGWDPTEFKKGSNKRLPWKCKKCGHEWEAMPNARTRPNATGCPKCAGNLPLTLQQCRDHAKSKGGSCLSTEYSNSKELMTWKCFCSYEWEAYANNVLKKNSWCPKCAGNLPYELSDLHKLAKERGGKCRSTKYIEKHTKYDWTCSDGHEWSASFHSLCRGDWCPHCKFNYKESPD